MSDWTHIVPLEITDYKIVTSNWINNLTDEVRQHIGRGWHLKGDLIITPSDTPKYAQVMVKYDRNNSD